MTAIDLEVAERLLKPFVGECEEGLGLTRRAWCLAVSGFCPFDTASTEALPTAGGLVGFSQNEQTDGALSLNPFRDLLCKLALYARHVQCGNLDLDPSLGKIRFHEPRLASSPGSTQLNFRCNDEKLGGAWGRG